MTVAQFPSGAVEGEHPRPRPRLSLVGTFQLTVGGMNVSLPHGVQRLLALLALTGRPVGRSRVAGQLWPDVPEWRALGNLRSALWRLHRVDHVLVRSLDDRLTIDPEIEIDLLELLRMVNSPATHAQEGLAGDLPVLVNATELLPGWEDDWVVGKRERFRQDRVLALEKWCEAFLEAENFAVAVRAAAAAVEAEPLRDSAQRLLVRAYLREGNVAAALRAYASYCDLMEAELGIAPSESMRLLVAGLSPHIDDHHSVTSR